MPKLASRSGNDGELMILHIRFSPRPFLSQSRVVEAWAIILPPMGFILGPANMLPPSRFAATTLTAQAAVREAETLTVLLYTFRHSMIMFYIPRVILQHPILVKIGMPGMDFLAEIETSPDL